ncbi:vancomycin resistance protein VanW [Paenibacillus methanolicus]|uniref:Vancomycin resistance protein VanW n=2 Tax=Paenibacillus methanolicus TaxID=582686 RepID=A0A5S5BWL4_9BACL|nr:vancomycin resistance protein VanW [Paenibacillus methanolicus]
MIEEGDSIVRLRRRLRMPGDTNPVKRSALRLAAGKRYFTWKRRLYWWFGGVTYAKRREAGPLPYPVFRHDTPTLRKLKDVEMWMQHNKEINLALAARRLSGIVIRPGETLSYWRTIGKPTKRKGYVPGMVLFYGGFKAGVGGGLCQLSNLIYWMTLHSPLTVTERHRHSYDVFPDAGRTQPFGSGATCAYNYLDLMIRNDTEADFQLVLELRDHRLYGEWRSTAAPVLRYEIYEREHRIAQAYWGGYERSNRIGRRTWNAAGELVADEPIAENRALMMYAPLLKAEGSE